MSWFTDLFINEAKPALNRHSGSGSGSSDDTKSYILVDEAGNECAAVLVDEETVFDATANDIRQGKVAATEDGVTIGSKEIPSYHTTEGVALVPDGSELAFHSLEYDFTKMQGIVCAFNTSLQDSTSAEKVAINNKVYVVQSTESISELTKDDGSSTVKFGVTNDSGALRLIRYFMYREEY